MGFGCGKIDVWVLIPTISLDFRWRQIAFTWLNWTVEIGF
jgi:hypothetical protein